MIEKYFNKKIWKKLLHTQWENWRQWEKGVKKECPKCQKILIPGQSIQGHILSVHNAKYTKCEKAFVSLPKLEKHKEFDHVPNETKIPCEKCNFVLESVSEFDNYLSGHEHNQVKKSINEYEGSDDDYYDDEFYIDTCNYCGLNVNLF